MHNAVPRYPKFNKKFEKIINNGYKFDSELIKSLSGNANMVKDEKNKSKIPKEK